LIARFGRPVLRLVGGELSVHRPPRVVTPQTVLAEQAGGR